MGWCSGSYIFDAVLDGLFNKEIKTDDDKVEFIKWIISELENMDWDCQQETMYWNNELVQRAFKELHPTWFEEEE